MTSFQLFAADSVLAGSLVSALMFGILACGPGSSTPEGADGGDAGGADGGTQQFESVSESTCASGEKWVAGETPSPKMHPGKNCKQCHTEESDAPSFAISGTVYGGFEESDDCKGVSGATVYVEGDGGNSVELETNEAGNFYALEQEADLETPMRAEVRYEGETRPMPVDLYKGNCNFCHTSERFSGREPGRVVIPGVEPD